MRLVALTKKLYAVPLASPVTITLSGAGQPANRIRLATVEPSYAVTTYPVTAPPPSQTGGDHPSITKPGPGAAITLEGASGTSARTPPARAITVRYGTD